MSKVCEVCGKRPMVGNTVSHAHNLNKRRRLPNLKNMKVRNKGATKTIKICMKCLKANKAGI